MALIPIASVPNAPQGVDVPLNQGGLRAAKVGNENQRAPDLSGVAESLMIPTIKQGAFDGPAEGLNALGKGISNLAEGGARVAAVLQHAAEVKSEFQDKVSIAQYTANREKENSAYESTLEGMPEADFVKNYEAGVGSMKERAAKGLTFSSKASGLKRLIDINFDSQTVRNLNSQSIRQTVERGRGVLMAEADSNFENGMRAEADGKLDELYRLGAIRLDQVEEKKLAWDKITTNNTMTGFQTDNPKQLHEDIVKYQEGKPNPAFDILFKGASKNEDVAQWVNSSGQNLRKVQNEAAIELDNSILRREITTETEIRKITDYVGLSEEDTQSFIQSLSVVKRNSPEGQAEYLKNYDSLWIKSVNYNLAGDENGKIRMGILRDIRSQAIEGERQPLLDNLREAIKSGMTPERQRAASLENTIDDLASQRLLIPAPDEKKAKDKESRQYVIDLNLKKAELKKTIRKYIKDKPALDPGADSAWLKALLNPVVQPQAVKQWGNRSDSVSWFNPPKYSQYPPMFSSDSDSTPTTKKDASLASIDTLTAEKKATLAKSARDKADEDAAKKQNENNKGKTKQQLQLEADQAFVMPKLNEPVDVIPTE